MAYEQKNSGLSLATGLYLSFHPAVSSFFCWKTVHFWSECCFPLICLQMIIISTQSAISYYYLLELIVGHSRLAAENKWSVFYLRQMENRPTCELTDQICSISYK